MDMQKPGPRGRSSSINPGPGAAVECKTPGAHWKKLTCSTICRKHGISVELAWNHENSTLIPHCGNFKFHITYAEAGYQLWN